MSRTRNVKQDSRNAVDKAGLRERHGLSGSAHRWTDAVGKRPDGPWRPGKTAARRRGK